MVPDDATSTRFGRGGLNCGLKTDGHNPVAVAPDPHAADVDGLACVGLVEAGHHDGIAKIKHARGYERSRRGTHAGLLLLIESGHAAGLVDWMVAIRTDLNKLVGNMRSPRFGIVRGDTGLESLPRRDDGALGFIRGLEGDALAGIFTVVHTGTGRSGRLVELRDFVIDEGAPARGTLHPDAENVDFSARGHDGSDVAIGALAGFGIGFVAEGGLGKGFQDFGAR
jgi:hypothetical protein